MRQWLMVVTVLMIVTVFVFKKMLVIISVLFVGFNCFYASEILA